MQKENEQELGIDGESELHPAEWSGCLTDSVRRAADHQNGVFAEHPNSRVSLPAAAAPPEEQQRDAAQSDRQRERREDDPDDGTLLQPLAERTGRLKILVEQHQTC